MTRINVGIPPAKLSRQHLLAEHREIKRIPNKIRKGWKVKKEDIPKEFCLGKGHVKFFYDKLDYLEDRYDDLYVECLRRGYKVQSYADAWDFDYDYTFHWDDDYWTPSKKDVQLIKDRLMERDPVFYSKIL